jgi:hypothetical protein
MTSEEIKNVLELHKKWLNKEQGGERADLSEADLSEADLDFSCFPLWCGGSRFKCDTKLVYQLLAHICTLEFDDTEGIKDLIMPFAVKSHRAVDLGLKGELE